LSTSGNGTWTGIGGPPLREAAFLLLLAAIATAASWAVRPDRLPLVADSRVYQLELPAPLVDTATALGLFDEGVHLFIDTRDIEPGSAATISGALPIRPSSFDDDLMDLFDFLMPEDPLVLFGDGDLNATANLATRLLDRGYTDLLILDGGLAAWEKAGGDISPASGGAP
jgi:hypothetical protein